MTRYKQVRGFTFIEVMTALSIIAVASIGVLLMRDWAVGNARVAEAKSLMATVQSGMQIWRPRSGSYSGVSMQELSSIAAVPVSWADGSGVNPWGGNVEVRADSADDTRYVISLNGINYAEEGARLARDLADLAIIATFSNAALSVTFQG